MRKNFSIPITLVNADIEHSIAQAQIGDYMGDDCWGYRLSMTNNIKAFNELYLDDDEGDEDYEEYR